MVDSLLGGNSLNYVGFRACVCRVSLPARCEHMHVKLKDLYRQKELAGGQDKNRFHRETRNGAWLRSVPYRLNSTELAWEELQDNLCLRHGLMHQDILVNCDGCGKRFLTKHTLSCQECDLVLAWHDDAAKEWGTLGAWDLVSLAITYKPKINSRAVQGDRTGDGARQESGTAYGGADTEGESQVGSGPKVNGAARLAGRLGQIQVPA